MTPEEREQMIWDDDVLWAYRQEQIIKDGYREVWFVIAVLLVLLIAI